MGGASLEQEYPAKALKIIVFFYTNYGKTNDWMVLDRSNINTKMTILRVCNKNVIECIS